MTVICYYWWDITPTSFPADEKEKEKSNSAYCGHLHRYPHCIRKLPVFSNGTNLAVAEQIVSESGSACQTHVQNQLNRI